MIDDVKRLPTQIAESARAKTKKGVVGSFRERFGTTYQMQHIVFSIGNTTIEGAYGGTFRESNGILHLSGSIEFNLRDAFRDPVDIERIYRELVDDGGLSDIFTEIPGGTPYDIVDDWSAAFSAEVLIDKSNSRYG